jgi:TIR domain
VMGEVGAARALKHASARPLLIPIIIGGIPLPQAVDDLTVVWMRREEDLARAADDVVAGLTAYLEGGEQQRRRLFISHRHADAAVVEALVQVIEAAFETRSADIRCTSLHPYKLRVGDRTGDRLRDEIRRAEAVLGIITPDMKDSSYVLFELGAAWGGKGTTFPLLARGATQADVPTPIGDLHMLSLTDARECHQFVEDLRDATTLTPRQNVGGAVADRIARLSQLAMAPVR